MSVRSVTRNPVPPKSGPPRPKVAAKISPPDQNWLPNTVPPSKLWSPSWTTWTKIGCQIQSPQSKLWSPSWTSRTKIGCQIQSPQANYPVMAKMVPHKLVPQDKFWLPKLVPGQILAAKINPQDQFWLSKGDQFLLPIISPPILLKMLMSRKVIYNYNIAMTS